MVSVALQVVIASRDNRAVLLNLIYSVIVPPPPLSFSCCITECENSALFSLRGRNLKTSESWEMEQHFWGQAVLFIYLSPTTSLSKCNPEIQSADRWSTTTTSSAVSPVPTTVSIYCHSTGYEDSKTGVHFSPSEWEVKGEGDRIVCVSDSDCGQEQLACAGLGSYVRQGKMNPKLAELVGLSRLLWLRSLCVLI